MRLKVADYDCRMEEKSPGYFVFFKNGEPKPVSELILKDGGLIPEVGLVEIFDTSMRGIGFGQAMYNQVEDAKNITIKVSDNLSYAAFKFWVNRDPHQVKDSLYAFRDQLVGKRVNHTEAQGIITEVRNDSVRVKHGRVTLPLRRIHLKELGLIPLSERELERFFSGSCISQSGAPVRCFHGSMEQFDHFDDKPTYFTASKDYGFIKKSDFVHECYLSIKRPFWVENQSDIESLKTFPDKMESLKRLGYDGVVYANPNNLEKGTTGWGNDYSQFIVFESSQIIHADLYPELENKMSDLFRPDDEIDHENVIHENGSPKTFFHGTSVFFREFRDTKDIGYHFGTKRAAMERVGGINRPEVDIEFSGPTETEVLCGRIQSGELKAETTLDQAFHMLMRKLDYPHADIYDVLSDMPESELLETIEETKDREDSESFKRKAKNGLKEPKWVVKVEDEIAGQFVKKETAKKYAEEVKRSFIKRVNLVANNPIRLDDLGVWAPCDIAEKAGLSEDFTDRLYGVRMTEEDAYNLLKKELKSMGYDSIVYTNVVEDKGSDSYIVFDKSQIIQIDPIEPDFKFEVSRDSNLKLEID